MDLKATSSSFPKRIFAVLRAPCLQAMAGDEPMAAKPLLPSIPRGLARASIGAIGTHELNSLAKMTKVKQDVE